MTHDQALPSWDAEMQRQITATQQALGRIAELEAIVHRAHVNVSALERQRSAAVAERDELLRIIGAHTPIAAFDLATTWHAERAALWDELTDARAALAHLLLTVERAGSHFPSNLPDAMQLARALLSSATPPTDRHARLLAAAAALTADDGGVSAYVLVERALLTRLRDVIKGEL